VEVPDDARRLGRDTGKAPGAEPRGAGRVEPDAQVAERSAGDADRGVAAKVQSGRAAADMECVDGADEPGGTAADCGGGGGRVRRRFRPLLPGAARVDWSVAGFRTEQAELWGPRGDGLRVCGAVVDAEGL